MDTKSNLEIKTLLIELESLYHKHIDSFKFGGTAPDLEKQGLERKRLFDALMANRALTGNGGDWETEVLNLIRSNQTLLQAAEKEKEKLKNTIKEVSKGKQALAGYGQLTRKPKTPKVMSFKG